LYRPRQKASKDIRDDKKCFRPYVRSSSAHRQNLAQPGKDRFGPRGLDQDSFHHSPGRIGQFGSYHDERYLNMNFLTVVKRAIWGWPNEITELKTLREQTESKLNTIQNYSNVIGILSATIHESGGFIWYKDTEGRSLFANRMMCENILMPRTKPLESTPDCADEVFGMTDDQIISKYAFNDKGCSTFLKSMPIADHYAIESCQRSEFYEKGQSQGRPMMIHSIRTPVFSPNGQLEGLVGFGIEISDHYSAWQDRVENWVRA
jgi:hypothetical protein